MRLLRAACAYAHHGWAVHPLVPRAKRPLTSNGKDDATTDLATVFQWWRRWPEANIGIHCHASGLVVIDVDPRNGGTLAGLEGKLGGLPDGPRAATGGGGEHLLFRHPGGAVVGKLAAGVDVKDHGYILAPPSVHPSGERYRWAMFPCDPPALPERWLERMRTPERAAPREMGDYDDELRGLPADYYIERLTGRSPNRAGFIQCPFHGGGDERTPSLKTTGPLWACHGCEPMVGKRAAGGNVFDFAALLWGFSIPLRGTDFLEVRDRLEAAL